MPEISVIVPCYKVEPYIADTIESVIKQSFEDWELLLVDDGSPDNAGKICDEYALKDSRIKVFHKENGGVMSARMLGLKNASGNFVMFLDGDDMYPEYSLELMHTTIVEKNVDWIRGSVADVDENNIISKVYENKWLNGFADHDEFMKRFCRKPKALSSSIYRKSVLDSKVIVLDPKIKNNEDYIFNLFLSDKIRCVYGIKDIVYLCHVHGDSASSVSYPVEYWYYVFNYLQENCNKYGVSEKNTNSYLLNFVPRLFDYKDYDLKNINVEELTKAKYSTYYGFKANVVLFCLKHPNFKRIINSIRTLKKRLKS